MESIREENLAFTADGYTALAILYATFSVTNWVAPSVIAVVGPKWTMAISVVPYLYVQYMSNVLLWLPKMQPISLDHWIELF